MFSRILAARGINHPEEIQFDFASLLPWRDLKHCDLAAEILLDAIIEQKKIFIVADYDADGATAAAIAIRFLRSVKANVDYFVPNRFEHGYGLTPEIVTIAEKNNADLIVTVDNGIASVSGVDKANVLGIKVLITDHHLPGADLPKATCIVNPNQPDDVFPSKHLAGVGVMFYVLVALRALLREQDFFSENNKEPNLAKLLDLVALGTVADVVRLDKNNRILVSQGIKRIHAHESNPGIKALFKVANKKPELARSMDLGYIIGPRLNAAGRLTDMRTGIECLITDNINEATKLANELDALNKNRRQIEADMQEKALAITEKIDTSKSSGITLFDPNWHPGIVGILASRIKERFRSPTIAFAPDGDKKLKGSGRSIQGVHLRDVLDKITKISPTIIKTFGGHAMAAGLTIDVKALEEFTRLFNEAIAYELDKNPIDATNFTDGRLTPSEVSRDLVSEIDAMVWGQGFPQPTFRNKFIAHNHKIVGEKHTKLQVSFREENKIFDAIRFNHIDLPPDLIDGVYRLEVNHFFKEQPIQLIFEYW